MPRSVQVSEDKLDSTCAPRANPDHTQSVNHHAIGVVREPPRTVGAALATPLHVRYLAFNLPQIYRAGGPMRIRSGVAALQALLLLARAAAHKPCTLLAILPRAYWGQIPAALVGLLLFGIYLLASSYVAGYGLESLLVAWPV